MRPAKSISTSALVGAELTSTGRHARCGNIAISNRAKGKAYDMMTFVYGALMVSFALMGVDLIAILLLVFAYLFVHGFALYYRFKFDKEM